MTATEISNMILYGLGHLNESNGGKNQKALTNGDIENIVGLSKNGTWKDVKMEQEPEQVGCISCALFVSTEVFN